MPRIVPIQLLKCLKVLLDDNGGILSAGEVKRLASLMTKYSKKLVSKCIYVQILKCTKTELLGEFMGAGGWSLVYTWLNDAIRAMNWPLVQEILELLLLCPVDVHRLKINSAPKLVKGLCKDGGNEGVRILAKRLVEQWLKVVTENPEATLPTSNGTTQATATKTPTVAVVAPEAISVNVQQQQTSVVNTTNQNTPSNAQQQQQLQQNQEEQKLKNPQKSKSNKKPSKANNIAQEEEVESEKGKEEEQQEQESKRTQIDDQDPLGGVDAETPTTNYTLTPAQKKATESGLVYKFIIKDGQSILAKVPPKSNQPITAPQLQSTMAEEEEEEEGAESNEVVDEDADDTEVAEDTADNSTVLAEADENSSSLDKTEKDNDSNCESEEKTKIEDTRKLEDKKSNQDLEKSNIQKDRRSSKDKERHGSSSGTDKEKEKDKDSKTSKTVSSSSSHRSSSSHKSSSSSSKSSSSSSSKSKSTSSSRRSSSDKHRSDKERSSSSKDKDKDRSNSSSSSSKHRSSSSSSKPTSSSSSKEKHRDKEKPHSSPSSKIKEKQPEHSQCEKDKATLEKIISSSSLDKLGKIPKKPKESLAAGNESESSNKSTSITIPSKKASMSIEIRKDTEKAKTVKTFKSQFRSHGLTEEAPPPPSRKGLKKPSSVTPPGTVLPSSLPSSLKRTSPPPKDIPSEKKAKIDINNVSVANEKPGAIKLIPPKKIQTLVETNLFSDALSAATGPKKVAKRKRPNTPMINGKEGPMSPTSPDGPKVMPLKFYQDTLDESKVDDSKSNKENDEISGTKTSDEDASADDKDIEDDDDIPLKKVKEDIDQKVAKEKKLDCGDTNAKSIDITKEDDEDNQKAESGSSPSGLEEQNSSKVEEDDAKIALVKVPGPGCGPNGPPGVLMLHRRKGPKKKLSWHPQETLEQIRYFELDENERCNVTKTSFLDMKNMEHFNERDAIVMARRGFNHEDNMDVQTQWKPLVEVDDVPPHPEGNQSKQRKIQAERELTTLRALYFTHALIPDSPAEAEFEPAFNHDVPLIPLDDLTGNPDAVNDFTSMPWPEPRGSPKQGDNSMSGTGGLESPVNMFGSPTPQVVNASNNSKQGSGGNPFNPFVNPFGGNPGPNGPNQSPMQNSPQGQWKGPGNGMGGPIGGNGPMMGNTFNGSPIMDMGVPGPICPGPMINNGPPQNFMNQFSPNFGGPANPFMAGPSGFNNGPNNYGPMGPNGPMMNGMGPGPMANNFGPQMMNGGHNNRNNRGNNNGGNWRSGSSNFQDNGGGNWRPAGPGQNMRGNNGLCKAFMRGHCRLGNSCKYIHPNKSKRI